MREKGTESWSDWRADVLKGTAAPATLSKYTMPATYAMAKARPANRKRSEHGSRGTLEENHVGKSSALWSSTCPTPSLSTFERTDS